MNEAEGHRHKGFGSDNAITTGAEALSNRAVMPRPGELWMINNTIPKDSAAEIGREGLYAFL